MSATKRSKVFVDIPYSPLVAARHKSLRGSLTTASASSSPLSSPSDDDDLPKSKQRPQVLSPKPLNFNPNHNHASQKPKSLPALSSATGKKRKLAEESENHQTDPTVKKKRRSEGKQPGDGHKVKKVVEVAGNKPSAAPKPKKIPHANWTRVDTELTRAEVEDRIFLREFIIRFSPVLSISEKNIEGLGDFTTLAEPTLKGVLIGLLSIIHQDSADAQRKHIGQALKELRKAGGNPTRWWDLLDEMRQATDMDIPDLAICTFEGRTTRGGTHIFPSQFLPCLLALCGIALNMDTIREDLKEGEKDMVSTRADYFGQRKAEMERWGKVRNQQLEEKKLLDKKDKGAILGWQSKFKPLEKKHKDKLRDIETKFSIASRKCSPRYTPFMDPDGRVYYIPSVPSGRMPSTEGRLSRWSWFVVVYGQRPVQPGDSVLCDDDDDDEDPNRCWGFGEPAELRKLIKWLEWRESESDGGRASSEDVDGSMDSEDGGKTSLKPLTRALGVFADFLELKESQAAPK